MNPNIPLFFNWTVVAVIVLGIIGYVPFFVDVTKHRPTRAYWKIHAVLLTSLWVAIVLPAIVLCTGTCLANIAWTDTILIDGPVVRHQTGVELYFLFEIIITSDLELGLWFVATLVGAAGFIGATNVFESNADASRC